METLRKKIDSLLKQYEEGAITADELHVAIGAAIYEFEMENSKEGEVK